jgi:NADPH-dependent 2,4-dienoyl-CoA reductase/sulfur reductase-like enzyme
LRDKGFEGSLTIIGDEPHEPYDRPPLSKQVLKGWVPADHTKLPRLRRVDADWKLGVAAVGLDRANHIVKLGNGEDVEYDRLLIATGTRARPWPNPEERAAGCFHGTDRGGCRRPGSGVAGRPEPGPGRGLRLRRLGDRLGVPRSGPGRHGGRARQGPLMGALGG